MLGSHWLELIGFYAFVAFATWLDLGVLHKDDHEIGLKEAAWMSLGWVVVALVFSGYVWWHYGAEKWMEYISGYTLEKALSVDNIFVINMIFTFFGLRGGLQHRALAWGVIGAVTMRTILITVAAGLVERFDWVLPLFGAFLLFTSFKMLRGGEEGSIQESPVYKWLARVAPIYPGLDGNRILTRRDGRWMLTTLGVAIVIVETTDLVFAVDSIPAVIGVSQDPFIVLTSNIFAILGLRALYFLLAGIVHRFRYLKLGLSVVLAFIGVKMIGTLFHWHVKPATSLAIVLGVVLISILASLLVPERSQETPRTE
ncbi:MAG: TerC family protein [Firmicutes bacterium]|nr:TerC family protein [Bacillota bacterium]